MAATSTQIDNFNSTTLNTAIWTSFGSTATPGTTFNANSQPGTTNYSGINSVDTALDLTGSYAHCQLIDAGDQTIPTWQAMAIQITKDATNTLAFYVESTVLTAQKQVAGVFNNVRADTTYNSNIHKWLRIRESAGTTFYDYSTDGKNWTNYTSLANPFAITAVKLTVQGGTYTSQASSTTAKFDNFNVLVHGGLLTLGAGS